MTPGVTPGVTAVSAPDLTVRVGALTLRNPVMPASGTFGPEMARAFPLDTLGALVTKSVTPEARTGNPLPRIAETEGGILNSIGIPGKGLDAFIAGAVPEWRSFGAPVIVSLSAPSVAAFAAACARLDEVEGIAAIEGNISCPNLEEDGRAFAVAPEPAAAATAAMRRATRLPLWVKLSPNTGDIAAVARAVEDSGADAVVAVNTILGLSIDVEARRPRLGNVMGGLSGPGFKPIALRMVWQCANAVRVPVIGCGGIAGAEDAIEFLMAGATAVQVGTASFVSPNAMPRVIAGLSDWCARRGVARVADLVGAALPSRAATSGVGGMAAE